jgi:hypothetical protein
MTTKIKPRIIYEIDGEEISFCGTHTYDNCAYTSWRGVEYGAYTQVLVSGVFDSFPDLDDIAGLREHLMCEYGLEVQIELFDVNTNAWGLVA